MCVKEQERAGELGLERMWNKRRLIAEESGTKGSSSRARLHNDRNGSGEKGHAWLRRGENKRNTAGADRKCGSLYPPQRPILRNRTPLPPSRAQR